MLRRDRAILGIALLRPAKMSRQCTDAAQTGYGSNESVMRYRVEGNQMIPPTGVRSPLCGTQPASKADQSADDQP
jgi:hypothetical protein